MKFRPVFMLRKKTKQTPKESCPFEKYSQKFASTILLYFNPKHNQYLQYLSTVPIRHNWYHEQSQFGKYYLKEHIVQEFTMLIATINELYINRFETFQR